MTVLFLYELIYMQCIGWMKGNEINGFVSSIFRISINFIWANC